MSTIDVQQLFFQQLKSKLPAHLALVDEIAEFLNISNDSAYRRIRGEKSISFEELQKLCVKYNIYLDQLLHMNSNSFVFNGQLKTAAENSFEDWLGNILMQLQLFNSHRRKHIYFLMKDIPPYVHFLMPELAKFKFFFWMKSILHYKSLQGVKFDLDDTRYEKYEPTVKKIIELYLKIPMTEIWNVESIESTLRQIAFYRDAGSFKNPGDVKLLYNKVEEMINHLERQAEVGLKFRVNQEPEETSSEYGLYVNELILGDNTIMAELDDTRITFLNYGVLFVVYTMDQRFNDAMKDNLENLVKKSMMISKSGEKERVRFFNGLRQKISQYRDT
ncbi:MAG: hypothetical protein V4725_01875 [Bacteroidota bacterium]